MLTSSVEVLARAQGPQPLTGQLRALHLVMVKGHASTRGEGTRGGLADVVQQRSPAQHRIGSAARPVLGVGGLQVDGLIEYLQCVRVDILVLAVFIRGHPQGGQFGQHDSRRVRYRPAPPARHAGSSPSSSFVSSARTRSAVMRFELGCELGHRTQSRRASMPHTRGWRRTEPPAACAADRRRRTPAACPGSAERRRARSAKSAVRVGERPARPDRHR